MATVYGTRQQLAGGIVEGSDSFPGPELIISGTPRSSSVALRWQDSLIWLASAREPGVMRQFSSLDSAWRECQAIAAAAGQSGQVVVKVTS